MKLKALSVLAPMAVYSSLAGAADIHQREVDFAIQPQSLANALIQFSEQARLQVMSQGIDLDQRQAPGVSGRLTVARALSKLLADSNLSYVETAPNTVAITVSHPATAAASTRNFIKLAQATPGTQPAARPAPAKSADSEELQEVEVVTVYGRGAAASTVREVPQTVTVFNPEIIEVLSGPNIDDVIRFLPSTNNLLGDFAIGNNFNIRGSGASYSFNGMIPSPVRPARIGLVNVERIEVLKGPSSITYGSMQPGAVINIVTKQPTQEYFSQLGVEAGSFGTYGGSLDLSAPLGENVGTRINASYQDRGAPVDHWRQKTTVVAPVVTFDLSDRTTFTVESLFTSISHPMGIYDGRIPTIGTLLPGPFGEIPIETNPGYFAGVTQQVEEYKDAGARMTHEFTDNLSLNAQMMWADTHRWGVDGFGAGMTANNRTVTRTITPRDQGAKSFTAAINIAANFDIGPVQNKLIAGVDYLSYRSFGKLGSYAPATGAMPQLDVYNPNYSVLTPLRLTRTTDSLFTSSTDAAFIQERATIGDLSLVLGARYTDSAAQTYTTQVATGVVTRAPDTIAKEWATQVGALYDFTDSFMMYANRSTSFSPRSPVLMRNGEYFTAPETAVQYEVGARYSFPGSGTSINLAVFHIVTPDVLTRDPVDFNFFVPAGELTSKGVELSVAGQLFSGMTAMAAYGYNPTEVTKSVTPGQQGREFQNAPEQTASLVTRYDFSQAAMDGLSLSLATNYVGKRFAEAENLRLLPAYTRVDLGVHYKLNDSIELSLQGNNLTDEDIYSGFLAAVIARNAGRNYMFNVRFTPTSL